MVVGVSVGGGGPGGAVTVEMREQGRDGGQLRMRPRGLDRHLRVARVTRPRVAEHWADLVS